MCPDACPGLDQCCGAAFDALYERYEREGRAVRTVPAQELWFAILDAQVGSPASRSLEDLRCAPLLARTLPPDPLFLLPPA